MVSALAEHLESEPLRSEAHAAKQEARVVQVGHNRAGQGVGRRRRSEEGRWQRGHRSSSLWHGEVWREEERLLTARVA